MKKVQQHLLPGIPLIHSPIFNSLFTSKLFKNTFKNLNELNKNGVTVLSTQDSAWLKKLDLVIKDTKKLFKNKSDTTIVDGWKSSKNIKILTEQSFILDFLKVAYGRDSIPFQTINKTSGYTSDFICNSLIYGTAPQHFMCVVYIILEDINNESFIEYYSNSHTLPILTNEVLGIIKNSDDKHIDTDKIHFAHALRLVEQLELPVQKIHAKKGDVIIVSSNLIYSIKPAETGSYQENYYTFNNCVNYIPCLSEPFKGLIEFCDYTDIRTDENIPQILNEQKVDVTYIQHAKCGFKIPKIIPVNEFDAERYLQDNPDVVNIDPYEHYRRHGILENRKAFTISARKQPINEDLFDREAYLRANQDVLESGVDAYQHYIEHGLYEDRPLTS